MRASTERHTCPAYAQRSHHYANIRICSGKTKTLRDSTAYQHIHLLCVYVFDVQCCSASLLILLVAIFPYKTGLCWPATSWCTVTITVPSLAATSFLLYSETSFAFVPGCTGSASRCVFSACSRLGRHQRGTECRWNDVVPP